MAQLPVTQQIIRQIGNDLKAVGDSIRFSDDDYINACLHFLPLDMIIGREDESNRNEEEERMDEVVDLHSKKQE